MSNDTPLSDAPPSPRFARVVAGVVLAIAAAAPGWFLWKHYLPLLAVFALCGIVFGGWLVGGAVARGRSPWRVAANGALAALLSFPIVGFFVGLGEACLGGALTTECLSIDSGMRKTIELIQEEALKSVGPVALVGALAALLSLRATRLMHPRGAERDGRSS